MELKDWVAAARGHAGWTQAELGERIGVGKQNVSHWEHGRHEPSIAQLRKMAEATGYSLAPLLLVSDTPGHAPTPPINPIEAADWLLLQGAKLALGAADQSRLRRIGAATQNAHTATAKVVEFVPPKPKMRVGTGLTGNPFKGGKSWPATTKAAPARKRGKRDKRGGE